VASVSSALSATRPHIGLNLIFLVPGETGGMEVAARELIPALLAAAGEEMRFTAFVNRELAAHSQYGLRELLPTKVVPVNARRRQEWVLGEQALLPPLAARSRVHLLHSLASTAPVWGPFRRVVTVHDLIYARFPEAHAGLRGKAMSLLVPAAARRSRRVIVDSQNTREDLVELLGIPPARIDVVPLGLGALRRVEPLPAGEVRRRLRLGDRPVALSLSAKRPHKNLLGLIDALRRIPAEERPVLVLPGYATTHEAELRERVAELDLDPYVRLLGWIDARELEGVWAIADAFVFPSLYEGFGLPVLEAMARGVPVACSNAASLPEVVGDAALLFDPHDEAQIATALRRVLYEPELALRLRESGREQARHFTWERTAQATLESYRRALA